MLDVAVAHVVFVHEQHVASSKHAPVAVAERVDGGVVLIVAAQRRERERCRALGPRA